MYKLDLNIHFCDFLPKFLVICEQTAVCTVSPRWLQYERPKISEAQSKNVYSTMGYLGSIYFLLFFSLLKALV